MKYQIESGVQVIRRSGRKTGSRKKAVFPLAAMRPGDSIVVEKNFTAVGGNYSKRYQNIYSRIRYIKRVFGIEGKFKVGTDKEMNLRILKIS